MQKQNSRNSSRLIPRKLALLVAAALAGGPAAAGPISFATFLGSNTSTDPDDGGFMQIDASGLAHYARTNLRVGDRTVVIYSKLNPVTGVVSYATRVDDDPGSRVSGLVLGPTGTPYVAGSTVFDGVYRCVSTCTIVGASGDTGGNGDAYVLTLGPTGTITQARYIGGSGVEEATGLAVDAAGNVYLTGTTNSGNLPATVGSYHGGKDVFVARYSPDLSTRDMLVLLGGSGDETSAGIAVDPSGNIYVAMNGGLEDFPPDRARPFAPFDNAYLVKLGPDGSFLHSTAIGASGHTLAAVQLDAASQPVVAGTRHELNDLSIDGFVARVSAAGTVVDYQRFGGSSTESVHGLTVSGNSIYVVGETFSPDFPSIATPTVGASGGSEAFVARLGPEGLEYATRFGGSSDEFAQSLSVAPNGDVFVMGSTQSSDFPITADAFRHARIGPSDLFIARLATEFDLSTAALNLASDDAEQRILITRTGSLAASASVKWTTANGTAVAGTHFGTPGVPLAMSGTVDFPPGVGSVVLRVGASVSGPNTVRIIGTASFTAPRSFTIALSNPVGVPLGDLQSTVVTVSQGVSALTLDDPTVQVLENAGFVTIEVRRKAGSSLVPATVHYATANGTAIAGTHYTARSGTLTFPAGDASSQYIEVPIVDNAVPNVARTFNVMLSAPTGLPLAGPTSATVTILDDDNTIALSSTTMTATEGSASVTLQVRRTGSATLPASVNWSTEDVTALAGVDFGASGDSTPLAGTLNWAANDLAMKSIVIPLLDDGIPEPAKQFRVKLAGVTNATLGTATSTVTINDNDRGFAFQNAEYTVTEGQPSITLTVRRMGPPTTAATVTWTTANGTATAGQDFGTAGSALQRSGTLMWGIGDSANKTITIPIIDDTIVGEAAETFTVSLATTTAGHIITTPGVATVTINENDLVPESAVQFGQPKYITMENAGTVTLDVLRGDLGGGFGREARINYATQPGTAMATTDYVAKSGTLVWPAGDSSPKQIAVTIVNDTVAEPTETFRVVLSSPTPGTALGAASQASVVILDDDEKFPPHGAMPDGFSTPLDATQGWHVAGDAGAYEGFFALRSDQVEDGETAAVEMAGTFAAGNVTFRVRVSSEPGFDKLNFYVDGVLKTSWSGTSVTGWQMSPTYALTAGSHVLRWEYSKDGSLSAGQDAAFIDALVTPTFTP